MMQDKAAHNLGLGHRNIQRRGITKIEDERKKGRKDGLTEIPFLELSPETRAEGRSVAGSATRCLKVRQLWLISKVSYSFQGSIVLIGGVYVQFIALKYDYYVIVFV